MAFTFGKWIYDNHALFDYLVFMASLVISFGLVRSYRLLLAASGQQQLHLLRIAMAFVFIGASVGPHLFFWELGLSPASTGVLGDLLELWGGVFICYALIRSPGAFIWLAGLALATELMVIMSLIYLPSGWDSSPWPLGGGLYPFQSLGKLVAQLPLYLVVTLLYLRSTLRDRDGAKLMVTLGMLGIVLSEVMEGAIVGGKTHLWLMLTGYAHLLKALASCFFLSSFWILTWRVKQKQSKEDFGRKRDATL